MSEVRLRKVQKPGYWRYETTGVLMPVVEAYLRGERLTAEQVPIMRAYLRQWIEEGDWEGIDQIEGLRDGIRSLTNHAQIETWLRKAEDLGIGPL